MDLQSPDQIRMATCRQLKECQQLLALALVAARRTPPLIEVVDDHTDRAYVAITHCIDMLSNPFHKDTP